MKFTPSSTSNFCTSKANNFGCLSGFLSRILCSKTPSPPIQTVKHPYFFDILDHSTTPPNVVAKLMGLDSVPRKASDYNSMREETGEMHRRPKTSFSFQETPDFFELQDDDFFVPTNPQTKKNKKRKKKGNSEVGVKGNKHRGRREKCGRKHGRNRDELGKEERVFSIEDRLRLKISAQNSHQLDNIPNQSYHLSPLKEKPSSRREESDVIKSRKKKIKETCQEECESENLSPVSVLDHSEFISDPEAATSEEDVKVGEGVCEESGMWEEREREGKCGLMIKKRECRKHERAEMLSRVNRLAEAEITNNCNSSWKYRDRGMLRTQELEDATTHFGQLIFDHLLSELVHQLLGLSSLHF